MQLRSFQRRVMEASGVENPEVAARATAAVLRALRDRLTLREADQLLAQLPGPLKAVWREGDHPDRRPLRLHRAQLFERVRGEAKLASLDEARWMTLAVLAVLKGQISEGEAEDVLAQLPRDLKELWLEADLPGAAGR
jgi:uncharacterized protein (DUF2267 family)